MKRFTVSFTFCLFILTYSAQGQKKIILSPFNTQVSDAVLGSIAPDQNWGTEPSLDPYTWTQGGIVNIVRPLIRFDLSSLPSSADKIKKAVMVLYYDPFTHGGGKHAGLTAFSVLRVTSPWDELNVTWNNQPSTTDMNAVAVPAAVYDQQNYVIDVTELVKDMLGSSPANNYGFMLRLNNENPYNAVFLASSNNADASRHPQLWVTYDDGLVGTGDDALKAASVDFEIVPNPASGVFSITIQGDAPAATYEADIFDLQGKLVLKQALSGSFTYLYVNPLPAGTYVLKIRSDAGYVQTEKIVLTK